MDLNQHHYLKDVLAALAYFDVFAFPLTKQEILKYSHFSNLSELEKPISELLKNEIIYQVKGYYSLHQDNQLAVKREEGVTRAKQYLDQAFKKSKLIGQFPYVKGVFISGSLSKGVMHEDGDIDFFIVTQPNRLWVARTLLILYKKIFLLNSRKYFCINYLVDENSLEIEHKNRFTAVELLSLYPMVNNELHQNIMEKNGWVTEFFSKNYHFNPNVQNLESTALRSMFEKTLDGKLGDRIDDFFMNLTLKRWHQKFGYMPENDFNIALKTSKKVSKHHPSNFQKTVLNGYEERMNTLRIKVGKISTTAINRA